MTVRFHITFVACLVFALGGAPQLRAQFDLYIAHVADGGGWFSQLSVNNPNLSSPVACTFTTFDGQGNPLALGYSSTKPGAAPAARTHPRAKAETSLAVDSVTLSIPPGGTATVQTSGDGDGTANPLQGGAELNCSALVIGGVTYWYTIGGDLVTGIGVPATDTTTVFRAVGGNENTAFAVYNPSTNQLSLTVEAFDATGANSYGPVNLEIDPNGHYAFNANTVLTTLPSGFYGSFRFTSGGQQFVPLALGVAITSTNAAGYVLYTIPSSPSVIVGIDQ
jgi:hypothetical protein